MRVGGLLRRGVSEGDAHAYLDGGREEQPSDVLEDSRVEVGGVDPMVAG